MPRIGIIGTAGREKEINYTSELYTSMYNSVVDTITALNIPSDEPLTLVSGGAAWADHIAVELYLNNSAENVELHIPAKWDRITKAFTDTGQYDWRINPGRTSNYYHTKFSKVVGYSSLAQIDAAIHKGAILIEGGGFHSRNSSIVTDLDYLIALHKSEITGGTLDTWKKAASGTIRIHLDITK